MSVNSEACFAIMVNESKVVGMKQFRHMVNSLERLLFAALMEKNAVLEHEDFDLQGCPAALAMLEECGIALLDSAGSWDISKKATNLSRFAQFLGSFAVELRRRYSESARTRDVSTADSSVWSSNCSGEEEESPAQASAYMPEIGMKIFWMRAPKC